MAQNPQPSAPSTVGPRPGHLIRAREGAASCSRARHRPGSRPGDPGPGPEEIRPRLTTETHRTHSRLSPALLLTPPPHTPTPPEKPSGRWSPGVASENSGHRKGGGRCMCLEVGSWQAGFQRLRGFASK